ncbi:MAG: M20 family metallopeptidase [Candidatus Bathyarchaeia archaeon]
MKSSHERLLSSVDEKKDQIIKLTRDLVRFDTTTPNPGEEPHQDRECQEYIAEELGEIGFRVEMWEPDLNAMARSYPFQIAGQSFKNRPILAARLKGNGKGRSLILNAHIDVVPVNPAVKWKHNPWGGDVENGRIYGRGSCDMKAGAAAIVSACHALIDSKLDLAGDLIVETVLDEEINGMGTVSCVERGYKADGAIIPEPSDLNLWLGCRGILWGRLMIEGRSGHADLYNPNSEGDAVNAIEKAVPILQGIWKLGAEWRLSKMKHPLLSIPRIIPTIIRGGDFWATVPDRCEIEMDVQYLPSDRDGNGYGSKVEKEIENCVREHSASDSWLRDHPPKLNWVMDLPPFEIERNNSLVQNVLEAANGLSLETKVTGFDSWDDGAHLMNLAGIPSVSIGPGPTSQAHAVDEYATVDSIVETTKLLSLTAVKWCGVE